MDKELRSWWCNCYAPDDESWQQDDEVKAIDALEDSLAPLDEETAKTRRLITRLETCHHKAPRHVELIIRAIGRGYSSKGPGTRAGDDKVLVPKGWQDAYDILSAWYEDRTGEVKDLDVGGKPARELLGYIGERSSLKVWQVQKVRERLAKVLDPESMWKDPTVIGETDGPDAAFKRLTREIVIRDVVDGREAEITLAAAIDLLAPCHWDFAGNLVIVLRAVGGDLHPESPYAACARNIKLSPSRDRMKIVSDSLRSFCEGKDSKDVGPEVISVLGRLEPVKRWLAASLDKTIRVQLGL